MIRNPLKTILCTALTLQVIGFIPTTIPSLRQEDQPTLSRHVRADELSDEEYDALLASVYDTPTTLTDEEYDDLFNSIYDEPNMTTEDEYDALLNYIYDQPGTLTMDEYDAMLISFYGQQQFLPADILQQLLDLLDIHAGE